MLQSDEEHVVQDGLLYFQDPKVTCGLHPMKQLKLLVPTVLRLTVLKYYHDICWTSNVLRDQKLMEGEI